MVKPPLLDSEWRDRPCPSGIIAATWRTDRTMRRLSAFSSMTRTSSSWSG